MLFHEMTAHALRNVDRENTLVILPIAACEQHGPHLPTGTDTIICTAVAEAVEQRLPEKTLLTPTMWLGASQHHLPFGATLTAKLDTYISMLCEMAEPLLEDGYKRLLILNGHGGNIDPMKVALRRLQPRYPDRQLAAAAYWQIAEAALGEIMEGDRKVMGHACEAETSLVWAVRPELVQTEAIPEAAPLAADQVNGAYVCLDMQQLTSTGVAGYPRLASPEKGRRMLEAIADEVAKTIEQLLTIHEKPQAST